MFKPNLKAIGLAVSKAAGRPGLLVRKHAPEIFLGLGVATIIGGTVLTCKSTLKLETTLDEIKTDIDDVKNGPKELRSEEGVDVVDPDSGEVVSNTKEMATYEADNMDLARVYLRSVGRIVRLYAPGVVLISSGVGMVCGSHHILHRRNAALMATYEMLSQSFSDYRSRVVEKLGEEDERHIYLNEQPEVVEVEVEDPKTGKIKKKKETVDIIKSDDARDISIYARYFDDSCTEWDKSPEYNLTYLKQQQAWFNNLLQQRGHVFLNEVYDALGIKRSQAGQMVGWIYDEDNPNTDSYIDFGIYNVNYTPSRDFVNGYNNAILLDFNVDGVIYDLI